MVCSRRGVAIPAALQTSKELVDALEPVLCRPALPAAVRPMPRAVVQRSSSDSEPTLLILTARTARAIASRRAAHAVVHSLGHHGQRDIFGIRG